jgi:type IV secretion system protein VirD4
VSLLKDLTVTGFDPDETDIAQRVPGEGRLAVADTALSRTLAAAGHGIVVNGGGYAVAAGAGLGACAVAGLNPMLDLVVVGACAYHVTQRVWDGWTWHVRGGQAAMRRRRKYQGEANPIEVRQSLSPAFAAKKMARLAPDLPAAQSYLSLGVTVHRPRQAVAVSRAESVAVFGVPQSLKTALISGWILDAPGPVLATSSRGDQYRHTAAVREKLGEVHTLDADGFGPGTTFAWSPADGCRNPAVAMRRAGDFMQASPRDPGGKDRYHEDRGAKLLRWALHAADLAGRDMYDVREWCQDPEREDFRKALRREDAAPGWGSSLEALLTQEGDFLHSATTSAEAALGWMDDPDLAAVACPPPGQGLDVAAFLRRGNGTIYLIGSERPYGSLTPFFSAFVTEFMEQARILAEQQGGRLKMPLLVAADEAATTAKIDFKRWLAVTAGYNITVVAGFQAVSQIETGWGGAAEAETILEMLSTKVIAGGFTSTATLERLAVICGEHDSWHKEGGGKVRTKERTFPPERIRQLPPFNALVIQRNAKPVQVCITPVWKRSAHQEVTIIDAPGPSAPDDTEE